MCSFPFYLALFGVEIVTVPSQSSVRTRGPITAGGGSQQAVLIGWEAVVVVVGAG